MPPMQSEDDTAASMPQPPTQRKNGDGPTRDWLVLDGGRRRTVDNSSGRQWTMADGGGKWQRMEATNGAEEGDLMGG
jgi:hypothetical protein